jgi:RHS repeat-associated protein
MRFFSLFFLFIFTLAGTARAQSLTDKTPMRDVVSGDNFNAARAVAVDVDSRTGKSVYVYNEIDATGTRDVFCAIYDESHKKIVNSFRVSSVGFHEQIYPTVKIHQQDNSFIVAWASMENGTDYDVYMKKISLDVTDATSASVTSASDIIVNTSTSGDQTKPKLAIDYGRNELVVGFTDASAPGAYARQFDCSSASLNPVAGQFTLTTGITTLYGMEISPVNAHLIAIYQYIPSPYYIYKTAFTYSSGSYSGSTTVQVNTNTGNPKYNPSICMNQSTGAYSISWESYMQEGNGYEAYSKIYSSSHAVLKTDFRVNSAIANNQVNAKVVWDEKTNYLIYFFDYYQSGFSTIRYRIMDDQYNFTGNEKSALLTGSSENNTYYTSAGGNYSLAYHSESRKITLAYDLYNNFTSYSKAKIRVLEYAPLVPQPSASCSTNADMLWAEKTTYDEYGNIVAQSRSYSDILGRTTQVQSRNIAENKILAAAVVYDKQGRPVLQTLPAPIAQTCFTYNVNFIASPSFCGPDGTYPNCAPYTYSDFDQTWNTGVSGEINNPKAVGKNTSALGTYYSTSNTTEPYVPESSYPYSRIDYNDRIVGGQVRSSGPGEVMRMGQGHEAKTIVLPLLTELDANYLPIRNTLTTGSPTGGATTLAFQGTKTITTDQNGKETVTFRDKSGRVLARALSNGTQMTTTTQLSPKISWLNITLPDIISITNLKITCSADIEVYDGTSVSLTSTLLYSGPAASCSTSYNGSGGNQYGPPRVIQVRSPQPFIVSYSIIYQGNTYPQPLVSSINYSGNDLDIYVKNNSGITVNSNYSTFKIYDLVKGGLINTYTSSTTGTISLSDGPYRIRIESSLPSPALDYSSSTNALSISYSFNYSDWSYVFYDDAGRPLREIAPKGVDLASISVPNKFYTQNTYNTLGWTLSTYDSDKGLTEYVYQQDGQLRFSRDARQKWENKFSYIHYNTNGDITEQGEYASANIAGSLWFQNTIEIADGAVLKDNNNNTVSGTSIGTIIENTDGVDDARCSSVNKMLIHQSYNTDATLVTLGYTQRYVIGRISKSYAGDNSSTSWYSYDEHGRMEWMVQNITGLGVKTIHYEYGLLGNLKRTIYQKGTSSERFEHKYDYDANMRLSNVKTRAGSGPLQQEALYKYYQHGPLKRTELAGNLQGIDYVYTIDGRLKSINHPTLDNAKDPGKDSYTGTNSAFAPDVFGMQFQYFEGDYTRTNSNITNTTLTGYQDQFSGAVKGMKWKVKDHGMGTGNSDMLMYGFIYDQKYQLTNANFGTVTASGEATFTASPSSAFGIVNTYDVNGNLTMKSRTNEAGGDLHTMDYIYDATPTNNRLKILTSTTEGVRNYVYDAAGRSIREHNGSTTLRSMTYNPYDLVTEVKEYSQACTTDVVKARFYYNERGHRIKKEVYNTSVCSLSVSVTTWYVTDADGNVLSIYDNSSGTMIQTEIPIYGKGRIGQARKTASTIAYTYELTDHLGTVRATINRNKVSGQNLAAIETWADYYADGEVMPTRSGTSSLNSRYGYQGQFAEVNPEAGYHDFDLRNYDVTIGRWLQPDPMDQYWSSYNGMGNNPVSIVDPTGGKGIKGIMDWINKALGIDNANNCPPSGGGNGTPGSQQQFLLNPIVVTPPSFSVPGDVLSSSPTVTGFDASPNSSYSGKDNTGNAGTGSQSGMGNQNTPGGDQNSLGGNRNQNKTVNLVIIGDDEWNKEANYSLDKCSWAGEEGTWIYVTVGKDGATNWDGLMNNINSEMQKNGSDKLGDVIFTSHGKDNNAIIFSKRAENPTIKGGNLDLDAQQFFKDLNGKMDEKGKFLMMICDNDYKLGSSISKVMNNREVYAPAFKQHIRAQWGFSYDNNRKDSEGYMPATYWRFNNGYNVPNNTSAGKNVGHQILLDCEVGVMVDPY